MDPSLTGTSRKVFTDLDFAGLKDLGWEVSPVPEPAEMALASGLALLAFGVLRRRSLHSGSLPKTTFD